MTQFFVVHSVWSLNPIVTSIGRACRLHSLKPQTNVRANSVLSQPRVKRTSLMSEDTILNEVSEELRADRMREAWRRYGPWVIGAAVLVVLAVAANEGWRWYQNSQAVASSRDFYAAIELIDEGATADAHEALNRSIAEGSGQYPDLSRFAQAGLLAREGKRDEAIAAYDSLATTLSNTRMREYALLQAAALLVDQGDVNGVQSRLVGINDTEGPFRSLGLELLGLAQYAAENYVDALATFELIRLDPYARQDTLQRIDVYEAQLMSQGIEFGNDEPADGVGADSAE